MNATASKALRLDLFHRWPPPAVLLLTFACFYFAIGPGNFFSVDESAPEQTLQALIRRGTLDIPNAMDAVPGRGQSYYSIKGAGATFAALPFEYVGLKLDDAFGSMNGGPLAGVPMGVPQQPLIWGGRMAIPATLVLNALVGGAIVAMLFMIGMRLTGNLRASMLMAIAAGLATPVMSEATHFFQHELDALMLILAFWFFSGNTREKLERPALLGGLSLGVAMLARPDAAPSAVVLWLYGIAAAWKLVQDLPDRRRRIIRQMLLASVGPIAGIAGTMYFNYLKFGSISQFGYSTMAKSRFAIDAAQIPVAIAGYLFSPGLSIFLFAPPLILALAVGSRAYRRWPLETIALVSAAAAHLLLLCFYHSWDGSVSYGPRLMLDGIVLLMPLTLPAFEIVVSRMADRAAIVVGAIVIAGIVIQFIGVGLWLPVVGWARGRAGIMGDSRWVFMPSESPIAYGLSEIWAGHHAPWAFRAFAHPGPALLLLVGLVVIGGIGGWRLLQYFRASGDELDKVSSDWYPIAILSAVLLPILVGFAIARPLTDPPSLHAYNMLEAGLAAQKAGNAVAAEEDYALVLSLEPSNKFARYNLGILQQDAGNTAAALSLYQQAMQADPNFAPARLRIARVVQERATK